MTFGPSFSTRSRIAVPLLLLGLGVASAAPAAPLSTDPRLTVFQPLGVEVFGSGPGWCAETAVVQIVAKDSAFFGSPDLAVVVRQLGTEVFADRCPAARTVIATGTVKASDTVVWCGLALASGLDAGRVGLGVVCLEAADSWAGYRLAVVGNAGAPRLGVLGEAGGGRYAEEGFRFWPMTVKAAHWKHVVVERFSPWSGWKQLDLWRGLRG